MKYTIIEISRKDKNKDGKPYINKNGNAYERLGIKVKEEPYVGKWLSGFTADWNIGWKAGDVVDIKVEPNGEYLNFSKVDRLDNLEARIERLEETIFGGGKRPTDADPQEEEQLPF